MSQKPALGTGGSTGWDGAGIVTVAGRKGQGQMDWEEGLQQGVVVRAGMGGPQWLAPRYLPGRLGLVGVHSTSLCLLFMAISLTNGTLKLGMVTN